MTRARTEFQAFGDLFFSDAGCVVFTFLMLPHVLNTLSVSKRMRDLTRSRLEELLAVAKVLNEHPFLVKTEHFLNLLQLDLKSKKICDDGLQAFSTAITTGALMKLEDLRLCCNRIGAVGMTAFADAIRATGGLGSLQTLKLSGNCIGDAGLISFTGAIRTGGALANLQTLYFGDWCGGNNIGDEGMKGFASAIASGALLNLKKLALFRNRIGDNGFVAFADAIKPSPANPRGALRSCTLINLRSNRIGDVGMQALSDAIRGGAMGNLEMLLIDCPSEDLQITCSSKGITWV
jgi:hypothetical protein